MTAIFAVLIAIVSLVFNLVQWMSRHRPYVSITNLKFAIVTAENIAGNTAYPDTVICTIKNIGEAPARKIHLSGMLEIRSKKEVIKPRELGILFPGQDMEFNLPFYLDNQSFVDFMSNEGVVVVDSEISYEGPSLLFSRNLFRNKYETKQQYALLQLITESSGTPGYWRTLHGGDWS